MKFLPKNPNSTILADGLTYQKNQAANNKNLLVRLLAEQHNFCAYSEKYIEDLDAVEVEHFDASKKYADNYFNYYAVLRVMNARKRDVVFRGNAFFNTLFFHDKAILYQRICYIKEDFFFEAIDSADQTAQDLIEFLGMNDERVYRQRKNHINRLQSLKLDARYDDATFCDYLNKHPKELSFITAIEHEFGVLLPNFL
ncbi:MAG: hypothetical protein RI894_1668 [Bacteroidota bacterium]|jgi:hypothetical protein